MCSRREGVLGKYRRAFALALARTSKARLLRSLPWKLTRSCLAVW